MTESEKFTKIVKEVKQHCTQRNIPTKHNEAIRIKIKRLVSSFKGLLAKRKVNSKKERQRQETYVENIHKCFNIVVESTTQMDHDSSSDG